MQINSLFTFHKLNQKGIDRAVTIAEAYTTLVNLINELVPNNSREKSVAFTKLEEASFFTKKAMAQLEENQESKV